LGANVGIHLKVDPETEDVKSGCGDGPQNFNFYFQGLQIDKRELRGGLIIDSTDLICAFCWEVSGDKISE
jgi:hypothetical protein